MYRDLKLSDRARVIEMAVRSGITDLDTIEKVYNTFAKGGDLGNSDSEDRETTERRKVGEHYLTLEQYKELQRDTIRQAAIQKALTRTRGVAPIINGEPGSSCIYTFTDNYGRKYQVAGTQTFAANPEKYGFEVAGPVTEGMEGNMYLQLDKRGVPYHATMITGYTDNGEPLLTYSSGHAGGATPISRERWNSDNQTGQTYEQYLEAFNRYSSPEADYHKNSRAWSSPQYETYRFIGTPDDNTKWQSEWEAGKPALQAVVPSEALNNRVVLYKEGGLKKRETAYARKYREEQEAKAKREKEHPTLNNAFRNDTTDSGESYYDIVRSRYDSAMRAMQRRGFTYEDASRLAPMIVTQNVLEGGWRMSRPDNNFGGMQTNGKFLTFDSPDEFYDAYLDMLDEKWGQSKVVANNWRNAQNLDDWARILNHEDLRLWSKERYDDYTAKHPETQIYLYAPEWENGYKPYRAHLRGVEPRVNTYLDMVLEENPHTEEMYSAPIEPTASQNDNFNLSMSQFQDLLESNKSKHMAGGGKLYGPGGAIGGNNPIINAYRIARDKYLTDYANNGRMVGYPESIGKTFTYAASPYLGLDEWEAPERRALFSKYFGLKGTEYDPSEYIEESKYKPSISSDKNAKYYTYKNDVYNNFNTHNGLYKLGVGTDENGKSYVSLYDEWDLNPFMSIFGLGKGTGNTLGGTPIEMYDRIYKDEQPELYNTLLERYKKQNHIDYASGGKIHIKPENRGKFTALKKRTGHSASWFKAHGTPAQKKMATFALNARKWKHSDGGLMTKL